MIEFEFMFFKTCCSSFSQQQRAEKRRRAQEGAPRSHGPTETEVSRMSSRQRPLRERNPSGMTLVTLSDF